MKRGPAAYFGVILTVLAGGGTLRAGFLYQFDRSTYQVDPGQTIDIQVFLRETIAPGEMSLLATEGLFSAGDRVQWNDPPLAMQPARVLSTMEIRENPSFTVVSGRDLLATSAGLAENVGLSPDGVTASGSAQVFDLLLATFSFTAGPIGGETTRLRATDFDQTSFDTISNVSGTLLDPLIADASATIQVNGGGPAVPEPSTLSLLIVGAACLAAWRRQRRRL